jgi:hypothetical protein
MRKNEYVNKGGKNVFFIIITTMYLITNKEMCGFGTCDNVSQHIASINIRVFPIVDLLYT